jgi:hypothetical protein
MLEIALKSISTEIMPVPAFLRFKGVRFHG